jgi:mRNA-degrading endonuclease RelE of RelBE toxin-antitoxin system
MIVPPGPGQVEDGSIAPCAVPNNGLWRYRVRDYRLVCHLEKKVLIVVVVAVGHRTNSSDFNAQRPSGRC